MANILLGVTGSVAAIYTPELFEDLFDAGHTVRIVATKASLYFFDPLKLERYRRRTGQAPVVRDQDEWPGQGYERGDPVLHIELRRWADVLLIAPLDANTLGKLALGLCDNCLTSVWRAWERPRPVVLAPAMNTLMWEHPATRRHLRQLAEDVGGADVPDVPLEPLIEWINRQRFSLRVVAPASKRLACDEVGVGAMASRDAVIDAVELALNRPTPTVLPTAIRPGEAPPGP